MGTVHKPLLQVAVAESVEGVAGSHTEGLQGVDSLLLLEAGAAGRAGGDSVGLGLNSPGSVGVVIGTSQLIGAVAGLVHLVSGSCPDARAVEVALADRT